MTSGVDDIRAVWDGLTPMSSFSGSDTENLRVVSWDQLVQIMHALTPSQLCNSHQLPDPDKAAVRVAAHWYGLHDTDIVGQSRRSHISLARKMACLLMRDVGKMSYDSIGHALNRDHTTILYLVRSARETIEMQKSVFVQWHAMRKALQDFIEKQKHGYQEEEAREQAVAGDAQRAPTA